MRSEFLALGAFALLAACATPKAPEPPAVAVEEPEPSPVSGTAITGATVPDIIKVTARGHDPRVGSLADYLKLLSGASCPADTPKVAAQDVALKATPVPLLPSDPANTKLGELTYVGGYQLTSPDKRFGGVSSIDFLTDGNLLGVTDQGDFVWIDLAADGLTPVRARIEKMHDASGAELNDKVWADAEGVAVNGGMALVSFERNHRILAYDLGRCGPAARGAPISFGGFSEPLPKAFQEAGLEVTENNGIEALAVTPDWYVFAGVETASTLGMSPLSARAIEASPDFSMRIGVGTPEIVDLDVVTTDPIGGRVRAFSLHRSYTPKAGTTIALNETDYIRYLDDSGVTRGIKGELDDRDHRRFVETGWRALAKLTAPFTVDNFEGVAAKPLPDGRVRLYLISDDNFSADQRTLLMIFDLKKTLT